MAEPTEPADTSAASRGERLLELVAVMDRLRSPGGCPWDAKQTHESLVEYLIEETYETVHAIESGARADLREELGDLLLQVVFHARIAQEEPDPFDIDDVAAGIVAKLVSRHPHVFGDATAATAADVEANWQRIKAEEKGRTSATDGIPPGLPALLLAAKLHGRATNAGLDVPVHPELRATAARAWDEAAEAGQDPAFALGELLLALSVAAKERGLDAEAALRAAAVRHGERIRSAEES